MRTIAGVLTLTVALAACSAGEPASDAPATIPPPVESSTTATGGTVPESTTASPAPTSEPTSASTTATAAPDGELQGLALEQVDSSVPFPVFMTPLPGTDLAVIAAKDGTLWLYGPDGVAADAWLNVRGEVRNDGEQGLLGLAFAPDFTTSGRLFLHYTANDGDTVLAEMTADLAPDIPTLDPATAVEVFRTEQPASNHNGGMIEFGPDGFLYLGLGDGGRSNDAFGHGQNEETVLGALLRFDVSQAGVALPAGSGFSAAEVWSIGLRNPWRFAIDDETRLIVIADVGQNGFEEVSVSRLGDAGLNYGWPITEGSHCFRPATGCDTTGLTLPVLEVSHNDSRTCSITGGFVYRGSLIPELDGHYFFSDFCGGYLRSFSVETSVPEVVDWTEQAGRTSRVTSFGRDAEGELYVLSADNRIYKIVPIRG